MPGSPRSHPRVQVYQDIEALSQSAAELVVQYANGSVASRGLFTLVLAGGGTPRQLYRTLSQPKFRGLWPWALTHFFWGDERCVPPTHPESNFRQAKELLLDPLAIRPENVHRILGELEPAAAAEAYAGRLRQETEPGRAWPRFDLVLLGMGDDGHTASLFPGPIQLAERREPVIPVTVEYGGRPANRVTLTPLVFNDARRVLFLVSGAGKAEALAGALLGPPDPERWPVQRIRPAAGQVIWMVDEAAASKDR